MGKRQPAQTGDCGPAPLHHLPLARVREERPMLFIGSPMCTAFSAWQRINNLIRDPQIVETEKKRAIEHLEFSILLYRDQLRNGRYFLHEHPAYATSGQEDAMKSLVAEVGVETAVCDQCMYGSTSFDGSPVQKPTKFVTNAIELAKKLCKRCVARDGTCSRPAGGVRAQCRGKVARKTAAYEYKLCRAILTGFRDQLRADGLYKDGFIGMLEEQGDRPDMVPVLHLTSASGAILKTQVQNDEVF